MIEIFNLLCLSLNVPKCIIEKNFNLPESEMIQVSKADLLKLGEEYVKLNLNHVYGCIKIRFD
jgi:hypothetical protein